MRTTRTNTTPTPQEPVFKESCRHYWIIESAQGPTSRGVCKFCGAQREFHNSWPYFPVEKRAQPRAQEEADAKLKEAGKNV